MRTNVMVPDGLIFAGYSLTTLGHNLRYIILSKLAPLDYVNAKDIILTITIDDWREFIEIETPNEQIICENPWRDIRRAMNSMEKCNVNFFEIDVCRPFIKSSEYITNGVEITLSGEFLSACILESYAISLKEQIVDLF